jgi:hypothetical protein
LLTGESAQLLGRILRVGLGIVGADGYDAHALIGIVLAQACELAFDVLDIWAMLADEHDQQSLAALEGIQRYLAAGYHVRQLEARGFGP